VVEISAEIPRNRFQIVGQLGRGALAEVFLCKLRGVAGFEKEVVVKRISADYAADPLFVRMFLDEARVAARLTHPNIVQVFEVGEEEGVPYIAMEYVRGVTLEMVIRRAHQENKVHHGHFAQIIAKICDALAYAHSAVDQDGEPVGLVHREVSPANIVLNLDGIPKLLDFGMAAAKDRLLHTQDGMLTGELRYMAPEQVSRGRLDHRADVFSLGITLFELTTGVNPFGPAGQRDTDVLQKVLNAPIPRPSQIVPGYPQTLEKIVLSAIERNVDKRCPSAREFRDRLEVFAVKKEHLSTPRSLAAWIRELFPDFANVTRASEVTAPRPLPTAGGVPVTVSSLRSTPTHAIDAPPLVSFRGGSNSWKWAAFGALGLALAAAVWALTRTDSSGPGTRAAAPSNPAAVTAPVVPPAIPPAPDSDAEAKVYIEAGESFANEKRYDAALEMANKAGTVPIKNPSLAVRLTRLRERATAELAAARRNNAPAPTPVPEPAEPEPTRPVASAPGEEGGGSLAGGQNGLNRPRFRQAGPNQKPGPGNRGRLAIDEGPRFRRRLPTEGPGPGPRRFDPAAPGRRPGGVASGPPSPSVPAGPLPTPAEAPPPPVETPAPLRTPDPGTPAEPRVAARPPAPETGPALTPAGSRSTPPPAPVPPRPSGPVVSTVPKSPVPIPTLPREVVARDGDMLTRVCTAVESTAISLAGVSPEFARGITAPLKRRVGLNAAVYPVAMYYFIVREAALKHDNITAGANLAAAHASGLILKLKNLPGIERAL
jgi:serine/threonine protein kinase